MNYKSICILGIVLSPVLMFGDIHFAGVNLAGAEFGSSVPGTYSVDYTYPDQQEVKYFRTKGMNIVRLPFLWERLQPSLNGELDENEFARLNTVVSVAVAQEMFIILDPHNYARYHNEIIGSQAVSISAFSNFWSRIANVYKTNRYIIFGLMNEPNNMSTESWRDAANTAITAIRRTGATNLILVPGNAWTGAHSWFDGWYGTPNSSAMLAIEDPITNFAFEVHQYLDSDASGTSSDVVSATVGVERIADFTSWLKANHFKGFLAEFAVANSQIGNGQTGEQALRNMLEYIDANSDVWLGWTWWAAGPWWNDYMFTIEPMNIGQPEQADRPAFEVLQSFFSFPELMLRITGSLQLTFKTVSGFQYQRQRCVDLVAGTWTDYGSPINGTGGTATFILGPAHEQEFYRVLISRAP